MFNFQCCERCATGVACMSLNNEKKKMPNLAARYDSWYIYLFLIKKCGFQERICFPENWSLCSSVVHKMAIKFQKVLGFCKFHSHCSIQCCIFKTKLSSLCCHLHVIICWSSFLIGHEHFLTAQFNFMEKLPDSLP